jgi:ketosteroid isomerase-like protein
MPMNASADAVSRRLVAEYNLGTPDWVEACHAESTEWIELPFAGGAGRGGGRAELRKAAELQVANFPDRRMEILNVVAGGDQAALEVEWTGTAAQTTAWAPKGTTLRLRAVLMLKIADGKVVREVDYVIPIP